MLRGIGRHLVVALLLVAPVVRSALAQEPSAATLRVATRVVPPLVVDQSGMLGGFSIDLWNSIADRLKAKANYQIAEDISGLLETVRSGNADLGISAISITSTREVEFDFSQPILSAGLQIMVRGATEDVGSRPMRDLEPTVLAHNTDMACHRRAAHRDPRTSDMVVRAARP